MRRNYFALALGATALIMFAPASARAQQASGVDELRARIAALEADNARRAAEIEALKGALDRIEGKPTTPTPTPVAQVAPSPPATAPAAAANPLQLSGDVRVRYEENWGAGRRERGRGVVRGRLRATYAFDERFSVGARIVTGDPDDPNSADITLSAWDDDLQVGLDQLFMKASLGPIDLYGGKFDNPFIRTDLVWDGDVNPQGAAAIATLPVGDAVKLRGSALYFMIDEGAAVRDSRMVGGQLALSAKPASAWAFDLAGGYYDYRTPLIAGADAGDWRSNLLRPDGHYLSDFNLFDVVGSVTFSGFGDRFPVRVVGDYVHNYGAAVADNDGFGADIFVGRASDKGDWRFQYGYAEMGVDAVLAAFSHDNTDLATNYLQHTLGVDFVPMRHVTLTATYYRYRLKNPVYAGALAPGEWANRLRLNLMYSF